MTMNHIGPLTVDKQWLNDAVGFYLSFLKPHDDALYVLPHQRLYVLMVQRFDVGLVIERSTPRRGAIKPTGSTQPGP